MLIKERMTPSLLSWIRTYGLWIVLFLICLILQWSDFNDALRYDRQAIAQGALWQLLSGHLVHLNWNHFWLNMAGLLLVGVFFGKYRPVFYWLGLLLLSAFIVGIGLFYFNTDMKWYVGMSGVLHGLFVVGCWYEYRRYKISGLVLLFLFLGKLVWEQFAGPLPGSESMTGGKVMVDAHLYGAVAGFIYLLVMSQLRFDSLK